MKIPKLMLCTHLLSLSLQVQLSSHLAFFTLEVRFVCVPSRNAPLRHAPASHAPVRHAPASHAPGVKRKNAPAGSGLSTRAFLLVFLSTTLEITYLRYQEILEVLDAKETAYKILKLLPNFLCFWPYSSF